MTINLRPWTAAAEECGQIIYDAFAAISSQHNFPSDFPAPEAGIGVASMLLSNPGFYCVVAEDDGTIVGSNFLDERGAVAGLGPITVSPGQQNSGVGRRLMQNTYWTGPKSANIPACACYKPVITAGRWLYMPG